MKTTTFRVTDEDKKIFAAVADFHNLPLSAYIRKFIRDEARRIGILAAPPTPHAPSAPNAANAHNTKPNPTGLSPTNTNKPKGWRPKPRWRDDPTKINGNQWNHEMWELHRAGLSVHTLAYDYAIEPHMVRERLQNAQDFVDAGIDPLSDEDIATNTTDDHTDHTEPVQPTNTTDEPTDHTANDYGAQMLEDALRLSPEEEARLHTANNNDDDTEALSPEEEARYLASLYPDESTDTEEQMQAKNQEKFDYLVKKHGWVV